MRWGVVGDPPVVRLRRRWAWVVPAVALALPTGAAAHIEYPDGALRSVALAPGDTHVDGQAVMVTNRGFGVNMSGVRVEQCTLDLSVCDSTNVVLTTTGRNGRFGPHDNPVSVTSPETAAVPFTVKARFEAGGRTVDCAPTACVVQAGGGTEYARHAHLAFGVSLPTAPAAAAPGGQAAGTLPPGAEPGAVVPPEGTTADRPAEDGSPTTTASPPADGEEAAGTVTTRRRLEAQPASSDGAWSILPVLIGAAVLGALLLLLLARRPQRRR